jgi:hypothetical protein
LAKETFNAISAAYLSTTDTVAKMQLYGQWSLLRNEFNTIAREGFKQCTGCGGYGHVYATPCPTARAITALKQISQFKTLILAAEGAIENRQGIA